MNEPPRKWTWNGLTYTETYRSAGKCEKCGRKVTRTSRGKSVDSKGGIRYCPKRLKWLCVQCVLLDY